MKKKLTPEQLAALAAGASLEEVLASAAPTNAAPEPSNDDNQLAALAAELAEAKAAAEAAKGEMAEAVAAADAAKAELAETQAKLQVVEAAANTMSATIEARIKNMSIALGTPAPEKHTSVEQLVAQHTDLEEKFKTAFKVGAPTKKTAEVPKPLFTEAQLASAKLIPVL
jgi:chromosome segregation ATPase